MANMHHVFPSLQLLGLPNSCRAFSLNSTGGAWWGAGQTIQAARAGLAWRVLGLHALCIGRLLWKLPSRPERIHSYFPLDSSHSHLLSSVCHSSQTGTLHQSLLHLFPKSVLLKVAGKGSQGPIKSFHCLQIALVVDILSLLTRITKLLCF